MGKAEVVKIQAGGLELALRLTPEEREDALEAARLLDVKLKELAGMGVVETQRRALMAAFHFAFESVQASRHPMASPAARADLERRLGQMAQAIENALAQER